MIVSYVLIRVESNSSEKARSVLDDLKNISTVTEAWATYGYYDILVVVKTEKPIEIETVKESIKNVDGVKDTLTLMPYEGFRR